MSAFADRAGSLRRERFGDNSSFGWDWDSDPAAFGPIQACLVLPESTPQTQVKDGRAWRIGTENEVAWINQEVTGGLSITASIPPMFAAYATLTFPLDPDAGRDVIRPAEDRFDDALLRVVGAYTEPQPWWLGFLDTGATDVVLDDAPRVHVYANWGYVLVQAGPHEARTWRSESRWFTALPELMFPANRSWLVSSLWDDAWAGVGGSANLISALLADPELRPCAERTDPSIADMWSIGSARLHACAAEAIADERFRRFRPALASRSFGDQALVRIRCRRADC
jgi:hypothetical protein